LINSNLVVFDSGLNNLPLASLPLTIHNLCNKAIYLVANVLSSSKKVCFLIGNSHPFNLAIPSLTVILPPRILLVIAFSLSVVVLSVLSPSVAVLSVLSPSVAVLLELLLLELLLLELEELPPQEELLFQGVGVVATVKS
jgi:hypothetical protein